MSLDDAGFENTFGRVQAQHHADNTTRRLPTLPADFVPLPAHGNEVTVRGSYEDLQHTYSGLEDSPRAAFFDPECRSQGLDLLLELLE